MVSAKINFLSVHQCTLQCTLTGSFPLFDFFDLTQIIFHKNLCKLLNIKIDVRVKFQIQPNEKGKLIFSTSLLSGATRNRTGDTRIFSPLLYQLSYGTFSFAAAKVGKVFCPTKFLWIYFLFNSYVIEGKTVQTKLKQKVKQGKNLAK